jgi:hypothetical protein
MITRTLVLALCTASLLLCAAFHAEASEMHDLVVIESTGELESAQIRANYLTSATMQTKLEEVFGPKLDYTHNSSPNTVTVQGAPHVVAAAVQLAARLDIAVTQALVEMVVLRPTRKGKTTLTHWLEDGAWSREAAVEAEADGLIEIISAPSITTVLDHAATITDGSCTPTDGDSAPDPRCAEGSVFSGFELRMVPHQVGDLLMLDLTTVVRGPDERAVTEEVVVLTAGQDAVLALHDLPDGPMYVFLTVTLTPPLDAELLPE